MVANVLQGRIGPLTLPSLIQAVCGQKKSGTLAVREGAVTKNLYLDAGRVVFASSNDEDDRLGTLFLREGMISLRTLHEAAAQAGASGKRLGTVLVDMKAIRPQDLIRGVTEQVKAIVIGLFSWTRGEYAFTGGDLPTQEVITLKMPTADLVLTGIKSIESWSRIRAAVGDLDTRYDTTARVEELSRELSLSLDEWTLLSRCDSGATLGQMCDESALSDFEVCRLVWTFTVVGLLKRAAGATAAAGA